MNRFRLDPRLSADTHEVCDLTLCRVLLFDDCRYPWLILVPRLEQTREIHHLPPEAGTQLLKESCRVAALMERLFTPDKLNIGALGNIVPQLHLHHVARRIGDPAWPGPVWGHSPRQAYSVQAAAARVEQLRLQLLLRDIETE